MKRGPEHFSPIKQENRKKVNIENTAKTSVLGASRSGGAGWRDLILRSPPPVGTGPKMVPQVKCFRKFSTEFNNKQGLK